MAKSPLPRGLEPMLPAYVYSPVTGSIQVIQGILGIGQMGEHAVFVINGIVVVRFYNLLAL